MYSPRCFCVVYLSIMKIWQDFLLKKNLNVLYFRELSPGPAPKNNSPIMLFILFTHIYLLEN